MTAELPPGLPQGRSVELPGRGSTFIYDVPGPVGAPGLVLLHGWTVTAAMNFCVVMAPLAERAGVRVIAMDQRGHGRGIQPSGAFRLEDCADDVVALADRLGIGRFIPVGYSMGGATAQLVAQRYPERVSGLVLCSTAAYFGPEDNSRGGVWDVLAPALAAGLTALPLAARQKLLDRFLMYRSDEGLPRWMQEEIRRNDPAMIAQAGIALGKFDARPWMSSLTMPTAVVRTTNDATVSPRRQTVLASGLPNVRIFDVDADHRAAVTNAELFLPQLLQAVSSVRR
jgi:3-oxoadipate enol-lactonase